MNNVTKYVLGLDIGSRRIGIARALWPNGIPEGLTTLINDQTFIDKLRALIIENSVNVLVIGRPLSLEGLPTNQTKLIEAFVNQKLTNLNCQIDWIEESATSLKAETELGSSNKLYQKADVDQLSAVYILEDYLDKFKMLHESF